MSNKTVAIVEDEFLLALDLEGLCEDFGCLVLGLATSATDALTRFCELRPDVLVSDMELGEGPDGADVAAHLRAANPSIQIVFVTGTQAPEKIKRMEELTPVKILRKPIRAQELRDAILETKA